MAEVQRFSANESSVGCCKCYKCSEEYEYRVAGFEQSYEYEVFLEEIDHACPPLHGGVTLANLRPRAAIHKQKGMGSGQVTGRA